MDLNIITKSKPVGNTSEAVAGLTNDLNGPPDATLIGTAATNKYTPPLAVAEALDEPVKEAAIEPAANPLSNINDDTASSETDTVELTHNGDATVDPAAIDDNSPLPPIADAAPIHPLPGIVDEEPCGENSETDNVELTEDGVAEDFFARYGDRFRYDHDAGYWFHWTGCVWQVNKTELAFDHARHLCRERRQGRNKMATKKAAEGVEIIARRDRRLAVTSNVWDQDPFLLGTPAGCVNLNTGELLQPDPSHFISKLTAVAPAPKNTPCPNFMKFLNDATAGDLALQRLMQQYGGYCLTGSTSEHVLLFIYGPGGNGKSVFQNAFAEILGDYAKTAAMETFVASKHQRHLTEIAMLRGARFVGASETEKGQQWSEARINQLTGGDLVTANFMRQDMFTFRPRFKLMVVGNHKPQLGTVNDAARRRFMIVPFLHKPEEPDRCLDKKLEAEYPAILRWMIDGCLDWQKHGLVLPDVVKEATADYFEEQDFLGRWLVEKSNRGPGLKAAFSELWDSYRKFALENGEDPGSAKSFGSALSQRGFKKIKNSNVMYLGILLKSIATVNFSSDL